MFTAHIDEADKQRKESVEIHCISVAERASAYAEKLALCKTAELQGLLHDMGKLCKDFDDYINGRNSLKRGDIDHAFAGARYLTEIAFESDNTDVKAAAGYISRTIVSHHGLHDWLDEDGKSYFDRRVSTSERYKEILGNIGDWAAREKLLELLNGAAAEIKACNRLLRELADRTNNDKQTYEMSNKKYLFYCGLFERLLQSLLIDADFTSTSNFMLNTETEYLFNANKVWKSAGAGLEQKYLEFAKKSDRITVRRTKISESCLEFANHKVGVCRLIVPTGGGKTLSSLRFAIEYCKSGKADRIFYIAPFMSILEQNSDVIKEIVGNENFLEHYSDFVQSIDDKEELSQYELRADKWDTPVISTTLVQFLNTIFSDRTASVRRFHRLANSVIIIDEVQAIPIKCVNLFNLAVNFLARVCNSAVVLCTATQPCFNSTEYPIEFDSALDMNPDFREDFDYFHRTDLISEVRPEQFTYEEAADFCANKFEESGNVLIVVNTKKSAASIFNILSERYKNTGTEIIHLSTGMCPQHRRDSINDVRLKLGDELPVICVTTQLIEAGVDISFRCVVRSLAGLDNAAQAAGRCNRNGEYPVCKAYIINIKDENLNNLREIAQRQKSAKSVIFGGKYSNLLDVDAMNSYFMKFYHEQSGELSFNTEVDGCKTTLVDVLSTNIQRNAARGKPGPSERIGTHLFKTAGAKFKVIDSATENVIVPYNEEAEDIISELNSEIPLADIIENLRKAKKFTISLYSNQLNKLTENGVVYMTKNGVRALISSAYDSQGIGLKEDCCSLDDLIY